ncbi:response regulator transcription factor [Anaerolineales bacterium HSG6]|nr:response regulator transcription factor [Anaerolineales bacterium HSG6]
MAEQKTRVLLVDDHTLFREGVASIIGTQPDFEIIGEAQDGLEAQIKAKKLKPDLILMDIEMPTCDGLEATRIIKQSLPEVTIVMLTVRDAEAKLFEALKNGAQGYLLKDMRSKEMMAFLRDAMQGQIAITPILANSVLQEFRRLSQETTWHGETRSIKLLTKREQEVLELIAMDASNREIAERLCISLHTVKTHLRNILSKLQVSSREEAVRYAQQR